MRSTGTERNYDFIERTAKSARSEASLPASLSDKAIETALRAANLTDKAGNAPTIRLGDAHDITISDDVVRSIRHLISPRGYRKEGITALPIDRPLTAAEFNDAKEYFNLSYERDGVVDLARVERIFPAQKLYHATNALSYALQRQIGWLAPDDIAFVAQELCGIKDYLEIDPGFFVGNDPTWVAGYAIPAPGDRSSDLLRVLQLDPKDPRIHTLLRTGLLLEVDMTDFRRQLPATDCFVIRQTDINRHPPVFEVIAPVAPMYSRVRAVIDWSEVRAKR